MINNTTIKPNKPNKMKKLTLFSILASLMIMVSCEKYNDRNFQDIMKGRLFYTYAVDSIMEPSGEIIKASGTKLEKMRFRFKPDMTAIRYDSKTPYFTGFPEYQRFTLTQDETTMSTYSFGGNKASLDGMTGYLRIYQMDIPRIYFCHAVPDGNGMNGIE
jgi:hypothetical protein